MAIGLVIYFLYGMQHSVLGNRYPAGTPVAAAVATEAKMSASESQPFSPREKVAEGRMRG